ncbi:MAG: hypothetical protein R2854_09345 [Caldilineaceae bacterium]
MQLTQTRLHRHQRLPGGSAAQVHAHIHLLGVVNDTLRLYTPLEFDPATSLPCCSPLIPARWKGGNR